MKIKYCLRILGTLLILAICFKFIDLREIWNLLKQIDMIFYLPSLLIVATLRPNTSAWICRQSGLRDPPPEARIRRTGTPNRSNISKLSRIEYVTPSMIARTR